MEKTGTKTGQEGRSRSLTLSASAQPFFNYHSGSQHFDVPEAGMTMMTSSSQQKESLMNMLWYKMEKDRMKTGQEGSSRSRTLSASAQPFLNYHSGSQHFGIPEAELTMLTSSSQQKENLMDMVWYQSLVDKHNAALFLLKEALKEGQELRKEKSNLENINADLSNRLAVLEKAMSDRAASVGYSAMHMDPEMNVNEVLTGLGSLQMTDFGSGVNKGLNLDDVAKERGCTNLSPTPVSQMDSGKIEGNGEGQDDRVPLPKSIGIRSTGYMKMPKASRGNKGKENKQKVFVQGDEKEESPLELDVYYQGTSKTELCNKWQETGACTYEDKCHFAHGVEELRPVIRHPRYKTDVCRMLLNGDPCTYGHRCHFRHTLTEKEQAIRSNNLRALKPLNK